MERHIKARPDGNYQEIVRPGTLRFLDFARLRLNKGEKHSRVTGPRECVLDIFSGVASVSVESSSSAGSPDPAHGLVARPSVPKKQHFPRVGGRADVFSGPPVMLYIPPQCAYEIVALSAGLDAGIFSAPSNATNASPALLEGPALVDFVRRSLHALVERGAKPRHWGKPGDPDRDIPLHYGSDSPREIVEGVIADWLAGGGGNLEWGDFWFALPKTFEGRA